jgi:hypothetical protein
VRYIINLFNITDCKRVVVYKYKLYEIWPAQRLYSRFTLHYGQTRSGVGEINFQLTQVKQHNRKHIRQLTEN